MQTCSFEDFLGKKTKRLRFTSKDAAGICLETILPISLLEALLYYVFLGGLWLTTMHIHRPMGPKEGETFFVQRISKELARYMKA